MPPHAGTESLVEYFGQQFERENCGACDVCLADAGALEDATINAQKILSCVARTGERFGVGHIVDVLSGASTEMIRKCRHDQLSTFGLLQDVPKKQIQSLVYQLVDQSLLERTADDRPILRLNDASWQVLRGQREVKLMKPVETVPTNAKVDVESWEGADRGLFEELRGWRRDLRASVECRRTSCWTTCRCGTWRECGRPGRNRCDNRVGWGKSGRPILERS